LEEINQNMQEALEFHIDGLIEEGLEIPDPSTYSAYVEVAA
jgi:predicted RNase H-like HicB family nuclease